MSTDFHHESFSKFFGFWLSQQNQYLGDLISAAETPKLEAAGVEIEALIERVVEHYEHYYEVKSNWVEQDALGMLRPSWTSSLEDAFLWLAGWRPSMAFHLLYSKSGLQLEARLPEILHGLSTGDLGDLSSQQLLVIDALKKRTIREEKGISEKMAKYQETIADPSMVELSHVATKSIMERDQGDRGEGEGESSESTMEDKLKMTLGRKEDGLKEILNMADELRLRTLKEVLGILTKTQKVHFLIAAAELHLRIHEWGMKRDSKQC